MRQALKDSWWKVPLYCAAAGWISYQIKIRLGPFLAMTRLSDGDSVTVALDQTRWMLLSAVLFLAVLLAGGLGFFRRMTRQELFASSTVLVVWNVASGLLTTFLSGSGILVSAALFLAQLEDWRSIFSQLASAAGLSHWLGAAAGWASPWLFVLFGRSSD